MLYAFKLRLSKRAHWVRSACTREHSTAELGSGRAKPCCTACAARAAATSGTPMFLLASFHSSTSAAVARSACLLYPLARCAWKRKPIHWSSCRVTRYTPKRIPACRKHLHTSPFPQSPQRRSGRLAFSRGARCHAALLSSLARRRRQVRCADTQCLARCLGACIAAMASPVSRDDKRVDLGKEVRARPASLSLDRAGELSGLQHHEHSHGAI